MGERAMTAAEKQRRYRERKFGNKPPVIKPATAKLAEEQAARIAELEAELAEFRNKDAVTKTSGLTKAHPRRPGDLPNILPERNEAFRLRSENERLKHKIGKLEAALAEEPNMAKLRQQVAEKRLEIRHLQQQVRQVVKERDKYQSRMNKAYREAERELLTAENFRVIVKAVHPDRAKNASPGELAAAERIVIALRPLFIESGK
jgi:hypothetical protein